MKSKLKAVCRTPSQVAGEPVGIGQPHLADQHPVLALGFGDLRDDR